MFSCFYFVKGCEFANTKYPMTPLVRSFMYLFVCNLVFVNFFFIIIKNAKVN